MTKKNWEQLWKAANTLAAIGATIEQIHSETEEPSEEIQDLIAIVYGLSATQRLVVLTIARSKVTKP